MTNKKDSKEDIAPSLFGQEIDPEVQKKVSEYMELGVPDPVGEPSAPLKLEVTDKSLDTSAASAPLLPTEKLPKLDKPTTKETQKPVSKNDTNNLGEQLDEVDKLDKNKTIAEAIDTSDDLGLDDPQTAKAVEEIVAAEADSLIDMEDKKLSNESVPKQGFGIKIKHLFSSFWQHKAIRNTVIVVFLLMVAGLAIVPSTRYSILNTAGVRSSASIIALDDKTGLPLKNVELNISGQVAKSDAEGVAKVSGVKLGEQALIIKKPAFAEISRKVVVGWGSNPLGDMRLIPVGTQYTFTLSDYSSGKPINKAEAVSGESSALSNTAGEIILTVPQSESENIEVIIGATDYRSEKVNVVNGNKQTVKLSMVPAKKHAFISKRTGTLDLYKIDVDGKNEERVLGGTGRERQDTMALVPHAKKDVVALVSVRDNIKNQDGFNLSTLNIVNLENNETSKITDSERIQLIDWIGDKLIYVKIMQGASEANTQRHRLMSYDLVSESSKELASTNYFNDVLIAKGSVYYSPAVYKVNGTVGLFRINADGTNKKTIFDKEVWNLLRTDYDKVSVSVGQDWYDLTLSTDAIVKSSNAPSVLKSRLYIDNQNGQKSLWVDERDGKGVLVLYDIGSKQEKTVQTQGGLKNPVVWSDNSHVIYRISNGQETSDYIFSLEGGDPKKIKDVTNVAGVDRWYYY